MKKFALAALVGTLLSGIAGSASAATYTTEAAFAAAHPNATTVDFSGLTTSLTQLGSPYTKDGLTLSANNLYAVSTNFWGNYDSLLDNTFGGFIDAKFASSSAVGFYFASSYNNGVPIAVSLFNGGNQVYSGAATGGGVYSGFAFFGIDGLGRFDELRIDSAGVPNGFPSLGPISFGAVPEPATWGLMIVGFAAIGSAMRRSKMTVRYA